MTYEPLVVCPGCGCTISATEAQMNDGVCADCDVFTPAVSFCDGCGEEFDTEALVDGLCLSCCRWDDET